MRRKPQLTSAGREILNQLVEVIREGRLPTEADDRLALIVPYLPLDLRKAALLIAFESGNETFISALIPELVDHISIAEIISIELLSGNEWKRASLLLCLSHCISSIHRYRAVLERISLLDASVQQDIIPKLFTSIDFSSDPIDGKKDVILETTKSIGDAYTRASVLTKTYDHYADKDGIGRLCVEAMAEVDSYSALKRLDEDYSRNIQPSADNVDYSKVTRRLEELYHKEFIEPNHMNDNIGESRLKEMMDGVRQEVTPSNIDVFNSLVTDIRNDVARRGLSAGDFQQLITHAKTANWEHRRTLGYEWNCSPIHFLESEFGRWLTLGLTRAQLRLADPLLSRRLDKWVQDGNTLPGSLVTNGTASDPKLEKTRDDAKMRMRRFRAKKRNVTHIGAPKRGIV